MPLISDYGFSRHHRRDSVDLDFQLPQTNQVFPDLAFTDDKVETLSVDKLITGTIQSQQITLGILDTRGDVFILGGTVNIAAWTATNGFILGLDDSDSNREKFYIGSATSSMDWNVTTANTLTIRGVLVAGEIHIPDRDTTVTSFHVNTTGNMWIGATETQFAAAPANAEFYVLNTGAMRVGDATTFFDWNVTNVNALTITGNFFVNLTPSPVNRIQITNATANSDFGIQFERLDGAGDPLMFLTYWGAGDRNTLGLTETNGIGLHVNTAGEVIVGNFTASNFTGTGQFVVMNGSVGIGTTSPVTSALLELLSTTGAFLIMRMTTVQRDALTAINGMGLYNTTTNQFEKYQAGAWIAW